MLLCYAYKFLQMASHKIINDPVYGFITLPYGLHYDIVEHPIFQRLRRIKQLGLSDYVYPGATNTRFLHALGAFHLMRQAIHTLREKGISISDAEAEATEIAILLHDIGHGPYSHALEGLIIPIHHEELSLALMERLNMEMDGALDLAIAIFKDEYHKPFLHRLISGQLDMDRLDYLMRDSYFTGVAEGVIGYDRIIKMLNVVDNRLVVEEKGIYSIEKFLLSRRLMYWQVYFHKTVVSAEKMLSKLLELLKLNPSYLKDCFISPAFANALSITKHASSSQRAEALDAFIHIDDTDVINLVKSAMHLDDKVIRLLAGGLLNRHLFKIHLSKEPFAQADIKKAYKSVLHLDGVDESSAAKLVLHGQESNDLYRINSEEIYVLQKSGEVVPFSELSDNALELRESRRYYLCYPRKFSG